MTDFSHLDALELGLSHERERLARATSLRELELRKVWVAQREREVSDERKRLGAEGDDALNMSDAELIAALLVN